MKKTIITLLALAGFAGADEVFNLSTAGDPTASASVTVNNGVITPSVSNWNTFGYARYTLDEVITLSSPEDILDFSFTVDRPHAMNEGVDKSLTTFTFALTGSTRAIIIGHNNEQDYTSAAAELQVGTSTNVGGKGYIFRASDKGDCYGVSYDAEIDGGLPFGTTTITGQIAWNTDQSSFIMTLGSSALTSGETLTYNLGESVDVSNVVFSVNGVNTPAFTGATVSYASIPEPTTATLSLLALAGLAARRRRR